MIKVVSFDIGGTLLKENNDIANNYSIKELTKLLDLPYEKVRDTYKDVFQKQNGTFKELTDKFCKILNINKSDELITFFKNKFAISDGKILPEDVELLKEIKRRGYKIILFSNNCCLIKSNLKKTLDGIVDDIFYSYDLGYTKSDKESYQIIENKLGCKPEEFLHIGDTLKSDYSKPIQYGWHAIYFGKSDDLSIKIITKLNEILEYLGDIK